jgi:hypothetical protein
LVDFNPVAAAHRIGGNDADTHAYSLEEVSRPDVRDTPSYRSSRLHDRRYFHLSRETIALLEWTFPKIFYLGMLVWLYIGDKRRKATRL